MDQAKLGAEALSAGNYAEAIKLYTAALAVSPTSPDYLIKRSTAYQRSNPADYESALADANKAIINAQKRGKRELILQGQLRRAIALFGLERYPDSKFCFDIVKRMDPKEKTLPIWENKIATKMAAMDGVKDVTIKETPDEEEVQTTKPDSTPTTTAAAATPAQPAAVAQTPADKIRHDWYQNNDKVYFTLLAKGVPKDKATIDIQPRSLTISFPLQTSSDYDFSLEPLFAEIDPSASTFSIMSTKVEVVLKKSQPGHKWPSLEGSESTTEAPRSASTVASAPVQSSSTAQKAPSYPTSSRSGPKDWDKLASEALAKPKTDDSKGGSKMEEEDDDEGGDPVNGFFKKLYAGADADTRRAMMKSFSESNGTALSTNWEEVKKGKVETSPPEGLEAKKW
ncbi:SGS-domain-containing protein [Aureobasidium sp. EXF-12298]|nr:SGS-domain-containing protein [Aureobasidium sp. EXF-12298]KAI4754214.1 SGS-domain-containing protein [Aureobasidium sp. EXF-12344]KAI4775310.1 SGS-domain-containing protein [Aureobasidium sp. EXF-3400]